MPDRPIFSAQKRPTCSPQNVRGINPYSVGQTLENFCGRSTFKMPVALSSSYFTVSLGTTSIYVVMTTGAFGPIVTPCQGCALNNSPMRCSMGFLTASCMLVASLSPSLQQHPYSYPYSVTSRRRGAVD